MNLLQVLATGVAGAENGTAEIYKRGTSTFATLYANYDGTGAVSPTGGVALDANGRAEWFVNEEVDVVIRNAAAVSILSTNPMVTASNVEARSQSFTGVDYSTAASLAGYPVTLAAILDLWKTQNGAIDWKVLVNGVATTIQTAFSQVSGLFYNVRASAYGAAGDGTTDDTSAIQAAIDDANSDGGGTVFFPAGIYRITSALTLKIQVSLMGANALASSIAIDHASNNGITVSAGSAGISTFIRGLKIAPAQSNSGKHVVVESGTVVNIQDCMIGSSTLTTGTGVSIANAATLVRVTNCDFLHAGTGAGARMVSAPAAGGAFVSGCKFTTPATWNGKVIELAAGGIVMGNIVDLSAATAGSGAGIYLTGSTFGVVAVGNHFPTPGSTGVSQFGGTQALGLVELNSSTDKSFSAPVTTTGATNDYHAGTVTLMREGMREYQSDNTTPLLVSATYYKTSEVRHTTNTVQTLLIGSPPYAGAEFTLVFNNDQAAGSNTITVTTCVGLATFTVNANLVSSYFMRAVENVAAGAGSSSLRWVLVGSAVNYAP